MKLLYYILVVNLFLTLIPSSTYSNDNNHEMNIEVPKTFISLQIYCLSGVEEIKNKFKTNDDPLMIFWRKKNINKLETIFSDNIGLLEKWFNYINYTKKLSINEFKYYRAIGANDYKSWHDLVIQKCIKNNGTLSEECMKDINSEVFKCFKILNDRLDNKIN